MATAAEYRASSEFLPPHRQRTGSMSIGPGPAPASENGANGASALVSPTSTTAGGDRESLTPVQSVLNSEIGVATLLNRLKQSIATAKVSPAAPGVSSPPPATCC